MNTEIKVKKTKSLSNCIFFDTETTGLDVEKNRIIEIYCYNATNNTCFHKKIDPECLIPSEVTDINGWTNSDLKGCPKFKEVVEDLLDFCGKDAYLIAHNNLKFDKLILINELERVGYSEPKGWKYIDTLVLAQKLYPNLRNHKQDTLRKKFKISCKNNHKANKDVLDLFKIYKFMVGDKDIKEIYDYCNELLDTMPFGKYRNSPIKQIPEDYVDFLKRNVFRTNKLLHNSFIKYNKYCKL
tara:strand:- start:249 stop:971 length:723 start_codon:yes stop_codon:yes gene_type:complete